MNAADQTKALQELWPTEENMSLQFILLYPSMLSQLEEQVGLHKKDTPEEILFRVNWINHLRSIVSRRMPVNNIGNPIVTDVDLLLATVPERIEALLRATKKWRKA